MAALLHSGDPGLPFFDSRNEQAKTEVALAANREKNRWPENVEADLQHPAMPPDLVPAPVSAKAERSDETSSQVDE